MSDTFTAEQVAEMMRSLHGGNAVKSPALMTATDAVQANVESKGAVRHTYTPIADSDLNTMPADLRPLLKQEAERWGDLQWAIQYHRCAVLFGPPGTGKSRLAVQTAQASAGSYMRTTITDETCWAEVRGSRFADGTFVPGIAVESWLQGVPFIVDEIDNAGGDVVPGLHMIADSPDMASMAVPGLGTIQPAEGFRFFATSNMSPDTMPEALMDRFSLKAFVPKPDPLLLMRLPKPIRAAAGFALFTDSPAKSLKGLTSRFWVGMGELIDRYGLNVSEASKAMLAGNRDGLTSKALVRAINTADAKDSLIEEATEIAEAIEA